VDLEKNAPRMAGWKRNITQRSITINKKENNDD